MIIDEEGWLRDTAYKAKVKEECFEEEVPTSADSFITLDTIYDFKYILVTRRVFPLDFWVLFLKPFTVEGLWE